MHGTELVERAIASRRWSHECDRELKDLAAGLDPERRIEPTLHLYAEIGRGAVVPADW